MQKTIGQAVFKKNVQKHRMASYVLDTTALTTLLRREPGFEKVLPYVYGGLISSVNMAEVLALCLASNADLDDCKRELAKLQLMEVSFDDEQATVAARIMTTEAAASLSFPDLAALSLGAMRKSTLITARSEMANTKLGVKIKTIA